MKLLHIIATPRGHESNTLRVSNEFLERLQARYPHLSVEVIDLFNQDLPSVIGANIESKYTLTMGQPIDKHHAEAWSQIELLIKHFVSADIYLVSSPMWNFSIPYALKYYLDSIIQPGYTYKYNEMGQPVPLVLGKKMVCITSRGGDYSAASPLHQYDFQEPYLRTIFGFMGIYDLTFINAQPMDINPALRETAVAAAVKEVRQLVAGSDWETQKPFAPVENPAELKPQPKKVAVH